MFGWGKKKHSSNNQESVLIEPQKQDTGIPTVNFDSSAVTEAIKSNLREHIKLIKDVPPDKFDMVYKSALSSISKGRDLSIIYKALMTINGMSKSRASKISISLNNQYTAIIDADRQTKLGIKYATWHHSGIPCGNANEAHKTADGKPYLITKGMFLNGKWTWPGREDGCRCTSKPMIEGFDGYTGGTPEGYVE